MSETKRTTKPAEPPAPAEAPKPPAPKGRPTAYTPELASLILNEMASGRSLREICAPDDMPDPATVRRWAISDVQGFSPHYAQARELQHQALVEKIADLAAMEPRYITNKLTGEERIDPGFEAWRKTEIDALKWLASKILPKVYGDKIELNHKVTVDPNRMTDAELAAIAMQGKPMTIAGTCVPVDDAGVIGGVNGEGEG